MNLKIRNSQTLGSQDVIGATVSHPPNAQELGLNRITYRKSYFMQITFILFALTLIPIQYHNENFNLQMLKVLDYCDQVSADAQEAFLAEPSRLISNDHATLLNPNVSVAYLNRNECANYRNSTNLFSIFSIKNGKGFNQNSKKSDNISVIYLCIDDVTKNFILNETFLKDLLVNTYLNVNEGLVFDSQISILSQVRKKCW